MKANYNNLWARIGINLHVTSDEMEKIIHGTHLEQAAVLGKILSDGRAELNGESYIPGDVIDGYNGMYGSTYPCCDIELETGSFEGKRVQIKPFAPRNRGDAR